MIRRQPPKLERELSALAAWLLGLNRDLESVPQKVDVPASSAAAGSVNTYSFDTNYLYVCYAQNAWARIAWTDVLF